LETINGYLYNSDTPEDLKKALQEVKAAIEERVVKHGKPVGSAPSLYTINGIGTTLYGDTVCFTFFFIPLFWVGRYNVEHAGGKTYSFKGKLKLKQWQVIYNWAVPVGVVLLIILSSQ